ncbi:MAG TPA: peptidoglycan-binding domain-containing protein [Reyranellaceae bacterium]|nr:peptidoglycan-binding domain-containing protein [Reyranellaceae bacterium]
MKQAQEKLAQQGYDVGTADGVMGPKTQAALKKLQEDRGLKQSGQLDQETLAALDSGAQRASTPSSTSAGGTSGSASGGSASGSSTTPSAPAASQSSDKPKQ